jgi:primosomal protein N' (replication factor Y)
MFAEIAIPLHIRRTFTYRLPGELGRRARRGSRAIVPFGKKFLTGVIVDVRDSPHGSLEEEGATIRDIEELLDEDPVVAPDILELTKWMADYYFCPWGECLRAALPVGMTRASERVLAITTLGLKLVEQERGLLDGASEKIRALELLVDGPSSSSRLERRLAETNIQSLIQDLVRDGLITVSQRLGDARIRPKIQNAVRLAGHGNGASSRGRETSGDRALSDKQQRVLDLLASSDALSLSEVLENAAVSISVVRTLEKRGLIEVFPREVRRDPLAGITLPDQQAVTLTAAQQDALDLITSGIDERRYRTFLVHGVTGSGKTEIYVRAMRHALEQGLTALMLVPEISLTPMSSRRLRGHFGDALAILHSSLSDGERLDEWRRIKSGDARVVIGTRSAVFAPLENIGLIIVDEEHDTSYKQDETPRYNGRDTAILRASNAKAVVILGSATPSLETFHNAQAGKYTYVRLAERYGGRGLARVETIDMREVFKRHGKQQTLSDELLEAIAETDRRGEQSMILLNRRGYSSFLLCRSCGLAVHCPNCDVTLTYHRYNSSLLCHYCNYIRPVPRACDACGGPYIHYVGEGTEQLETRLQELFPKMNITRLDRDTTRRRGSFEQIIMEFAAGSIDMLVGTQMIAKGHDFHNVTLVGVVSVDVGLSLPDFRAAERTFQLLTQVAGRAGRGDKPGRVLIQTYHPEHYSIQCARGQDYEQFYRREIEFRRTMHYPPFAALINILVRDREFDRANKTAADFAGLLREASRGGPVRVLGPAPAPIARLRGEHRFQILIKAQNRRRAREALDVAMDQVASLRHNPRSILVEVDPVNLM